MAGVEDESVVVKDLFDLIHQYQVPTPPEDLAVYQVCSVYSSMTELLIIPQLLLPPHI